MKRRSMMQTLFYCFAFITIFFNYCYAGETDRALCGGVSIYVGESKHKVRELCGDPDSIEIVGTKRVTSQLRSRYGLSETETEVTIQEWRYKGKGYVFTIIGSVVSGFTEI